MIGPQSRWFVVLLGALMMVNVLSIDMMLPALPALGASLDATAGAVQLTLSLYLVGYAVGQIACGPLSDRFGRKPALMTGLGVYALASLACAASRRIDVLVACRIVQGVAACGGPVIVRAIVRDHFSGMQAARTLSMLTTVFAAGPLFAPIAGGAILVAWGWPAIFVTIALCAAALLLAAWSGLAESLREPDRNALKLRRLAENYRTFLTTRAAIGMGVVNGLCWVGIFAFISASPFVLIRYYGVPADHYGYYFGLSAACIVAGAATNRRLLRSFPGERVMRWGFWVLIAGGAAAVLVTLTPLSGALPLMGAVMIYMFGQTLVQPNAVAAALEPLRHMAGMGSALLGVIQMLLGALGGWIVNALYDGTPLPMCGMILFAALACSTLHRVLIVQPRKSAPSKIRR
jgi:DHA1 family bicyclomycin/chloramphenicol resistance-like MFS transporter